VLLAIQSLKNLLASGAFKSAIPKLPVLNELIYHLTLQMFGEEMAMAALATLTTMFKVCKIRKEGIQPSLSLLTDTLMGFLNAENQIINTSWFLSLLSCLSKLNPEGFLANSSSQVFLEFLLSKTNGVLTGLMKPSVSSNLALYIVHKLTLSPEGMIQFLSLERSKILQFSQALAQHLNTLGQSAAQKVTLFLLFFFFL